MQKEVPTPVVVSYMLLYLSPSECFCLTLSLLSASLFSPLFFCLPDDMALPTAHFEVLVEKDKPLAAGCRRLVALTASVTLAGAITNSPNLKKGQQKRNGRQPRCNTT
jgi:hypothetical protein